MNLTKTSLQHMKILSLLKDAKMTRMTIKNHLLNQTRGPREEELEKNMSHLVNQRRSLPRQLASLKKDPNLIKSFTEDHHVDKTTLLPAWFQKPSKPPTLDRDWNKILSAVYGPIQPWINTLAWNQDPHKSFNELMDTPLDFSAFVLNRLNTGTTLKSFNELMDTPLDFSAFVLNRLNVDTLTPELLAGPTFKLMKGSCNSLVELEYFLEEVYKATTDQLDWNNPEGQQYPHDLQNPNEVSTTDNLESGRQGKSQSYDPGDLSTSKEHNDNEEPGKVR
nr:hypothetical protein [Tanacetum cinerariifolium]